MASYTVVTAAHKTLTAGTVDTVTITGSYARVEILNRSGTADLYFTNDGTVPSGGCDNCGIVPAGTSVNVPASDAAGSEIVQVVGNGNGYSVIGTNEAY
jgi:hypothetical protein